MDESIERNPIPGLVGYAADTRGGIWTCWAAARPVRLSEEWRAVRTYVRTSPNRYEIFQARVATATYRTVYVHRAVLLAFVGPCPKGMECCHNDGDPVNNRLDNLRWDTHRANAVEAVRHNLQAGRLSRVLKLSEEQVSEIRRLAASEIPHAVIAGRFRIHPEYVSKLVTHMRRSGVV